jgi:dolichyl-phosphate-mannose-protein mannosyltransferase
MAIGRKDCQGSIVRHFLFKQKSISKMETEGLRKRKPSFKVAENFPKVEKDLDKLPEIEPQEVSLIALALLTLVAFWTRLYKINWNDHVVWDEAHFGKFAGYYIKRTFYTDVHPPLGKMLNGLAGLVAGFNGKFEFTSGEQYPPEVRFGVMRFFNAVFGALVTPLAYLTGVELGFTPMNAVLLGVMTITDVAYCVISRFILLDSMLLFFTALAIYCLTVFRSYQKFDPLSLEWYFWLILSGISIGLVGLHTIGDLWEALGDLKLSMEKQAVHWTARIVCLIFIPISVYVIVFAAHFSILNMSGPGDAGMSSLFQAGLQGNNFAENPLRNNLLI